MLRCGTVCSSRTMRFEHHKITEVRRKAAKCFIFDSTKNKLVSQKLTSFLRKDKKTSRLDGSFFAFLFVLFARFDFLIKLFAGCSSYKVYRNPNTNLLMIHIHPLVLRITHRER